MTENIITFIICLFCLVVAYPFFIYATVDKHEAPSFTYGFVNGITFVVIFMVTISSGFAVFSNKDKYLGQYEFVKKDIESLHIDTTFTTINNVTDTTYTVYYDKIQN